MNTINLTGNLTKDPELRNAGTDKAVARIRVAFTSGADRTSYIDVVSFGPSAEAVAQHTAKGRQVGVTGHLSLSEWEDDDGAKHSRHEIIAGPYGIEFLGAPKPTNED
jgi:single-strand DNA-binding protein